MLRSPRSATILAEPAVSAPVSAFSPCSLRNSRHCPQQHGMAHRLADVGDLGAGQAQQVDVHAHEGFVDDVEARTRAAASGCRPRGRRSSSRPAASRGRLAARARLRWRPRRCGRAAPPSPGGPGGRPGASRPPARPGRRCVRRGARSWQAPFFWRFAGFCRSSAAEGDWSRYYTLKPDGGSG